MFADHEKVQEERQARLRAELKRLSLENCNMIAVEGWRDKFLSEVNCKIMRQCEMFVQETKDGLELWRVADPRMVNDGRWTQALGESLREHQGVWYHVIQFIYRFEHYAIFQSILNDASNLWAELNNLNNPYNPTYHKRVPPGM